MSDLAVPSYRVRPEPAGLPWRMLALAGAVVGTLAIAGGLTWLLAGRSSDDARAPASVPVLQADARPVKVRPDNAGGMTVANQDQIVLEPVRVRREAGRQPSTGAVAPEPEAPRIEELRRAALPPPTAAPPAPPPPAAPAPTAAPAAAPTAAPTAAPPATAPPGRTMIQLGALASEDAARAEWARLIRRVPELAPRQPVVTKLDRDGQPALWRLRAGGLTDVAAARALCEAVRAKGGVCSIVGG